MKTNADVLRDAIVEFIQSNQEIGDNDKSIKQALKNITRQAWEAVQE
jgi:hypothetical protein